MANQFIPWSIETKTIIQTQINLYITPRLHKEGHFVGVKMPELPITAFEVKHSIEAFNKRMDKEYEKLFYEKF